MEDVSIRHCAWCGLAKAKKDLIVGLALSLLVHVAALGGLAYAAKATPGIQKQGRVIYLGEITIETAKKTVGRKTPKEI